MSLSPSLSNDTYPITVAARSSNLSKVQFEEISALIHHFYPELELTPSYMLSKGDRDKKTSLRNLHKTNFFTEELDQAVLNSQARVAFHSAKDLPEPLDPRLEVIAITKGVDWRDALVLNDGVTLESLKEGALIATSSQRREEAVSRLKEGLNFKDLRGTIEERLEKMTSGAVDGVVIALAALIRLDLTHLNWIPIPGESTPLQGQLAITAKKGDQDMKDLFSCLDWRQERPHSLYLGLNPTSFHPLGKMSHQPMIKTESISDQKIESERITHIKEPIERASHLLLTSPRAVYYLFKALEPIGDLFELLKDKTLLCIGPQTAAAVSNKKLPLRCTTLPLGSTAEHFLPYLEALTKGSHYIYYPHSQLARPLLKECMETLKLPYFSYGLYHTKKQALARNFDIHQYDELVFTSPSCVQSFFSQYQGPLNVKLTTLGPITENALKKILEKVYSAPTITT